MNSTNNNSFEIAAKKVFSDLYALIKEDETAILQDLWLRGKRRLVVIGRGPTPVKILFSLWLQKFVPGVVPQPLVRVVTMV